MVTWEEGAAPVAPPRWVAAAAQLVGGLQTLDVPVLVRMAHHFDIYVPPALFAGRTRLDNDVRQEKT
jgi:hypothetical protein